jgi:hypothetical protein
MLVDTEHVDERIQKAVKLLLDCVKDLPDDEMAYIDVTVYGDKTCEVDVGGNLFTDIN